MSLRKGIYLVICFMQFEIMENVSMFVLFLSSEEKCSRNF